METIEVISRYGLSEPVFRMKFLGFAKALSQSFRFLKYGDGDQQTRAVLVNKADGLSLLGLDFRQRRPGAITMLFLADLHPQDLTLIRSYERVIDVIVVPTPEMSDLLGPLVQSPVDVLPDPIDFWLTQDDQHEGKPVSTKGPLKLLWFGYPESYQRSMAPYSGLLSELVEKQTIQFTILTAQGKVVSNPGFHQEIYDWQTATTAISQHDVCVSSHMPFDFSMSTLMKSENKALLSIALGLPMIASRTPAYSRLFDRCGIEEYLFTTPQDLRRSIEKLSHPAPRECYLRSARPVVFRDYDYRLIAQQWKETLYRMIGQL